MSPYREEAEMPDESEDVTIPEWSDTKKSVVVGVVATLVVDVCAVVGNLEHMTTRPAICTAVGAHAIAFAFFYIMWRTFPR